MELKKRGNTDGGGEGRSQAAVKAAKKLGKNSKTGGGPESWAEGNQGGVPSWTRGSTGGKRSASLWGSKREMAKKRGKELPDLAPPVFSRRNEGLLYGRVRHSRRGLWRISGPCPLHGKKYGGSGGAGVYPM